MLEAADAHHVLCERLGKAGAETLLDEVTEGEGILVGVARSEALVGHVEEGVVLALLDGVGDLHPLLLSRVDTGGVVGAGVEQDNAALGHGLDVGDHAIEVQANSVLVVVPVLLDLEAGVLEDGGVVRPRGSGDIDGLRVRVVALEEGAADAKGTGTGDGLGDGDAVLGERSRVAAVGQLESSLGELGDTGDARVLLVEGRVDDLLLGLLHRGQHVRLALVVAVGADTCAQSVAPLQELALRGGLLTQVDLLGVAVGLEGLCDAQNGLVANGKLYSSHASSAGVSLTALTSCEYVSGA